MTRWFATTFGALGARNFLILWLGSVLSFIAFFMSTVVQSVVAFDLTGNNRSVGTVVFAQGIAQLVLGPLGGAMADRISRRAMLFACQAVITVAFAATAVLLGLDRVTIILLALGSFVIGSAFSFLGPSRQAFAIDLVAMRQRGNAMALNQVALNGSRILGPLVGGVFLAVTFLGATGAYAGMAVLYIGALASTAMLPDSRASAAAGRSVIGDIVVGVRYVAREPGLGILVLTFVLVLMAGFPYVTVLPGMLENELGRGTDSLSLLYGVSAAGGLLASLLVAGMADSPRAQLVYRVAGMAFGVTLVLSALSPNFPALVGAMLLLGIATGAFQTLNGALVAHMAEPGYMGRVMSLTFMAFAGFQVVALPVGFLADAAGERATLGLLGAVVCAIVIGFALLPSGAASQRRGRGSEPGPVR